MSGYIGNIPVPQATQTRDVFTATSGQTSFATSGYTPGFLDVWLNGVKLVNGTDFTATNGSDVVLSSGAATSDIVEVLSYSTYEVNAQTYTGGLTVNNTGDVLNVDRKGSDGILTTYKKDGNTVGYTTVEGGGAVVRNFWDIRSAATVGSGLGGNDGYLQPFSKTGASDNVIDLGNATSRFKNLYLSGGVYLGGTGGENYLDDYEEGTFNTSITFGGVSPAGLSIYSASSGYVKIGRMVFCTMGFGATWSSTASGALRITGLPFTEGRGGGYVEPGFAIGNKGTGNFTHAAVVASNTELVCYKNDSAATFVNTDFNGGGASGFWFHGSLVYMTS